MSREQKQIIHITPHLGGGVGKALLSLVEGSKRTHFNHSFLLLEKPIKTFFFNKIHSHGCKIYVYPDKSEFITLISEADIVQLEWWNHPATFKFLCTHELPPMRLLTWCHQSGLHPPIIPAGLIRRSSRFIFTSRCSLLAPYIAGQPDITMGNTGVVSSGTGLEYQNTRKFREKGPLKACYMGTLSFSKLHPEYVKFLAAVRLPEFRVTMFGDEANRDMLLRQCAAAGKPNLLEFAGYIPDISTALASMDIFPYLLNPVHYGTAENALLEAMSAGVVPIVLDNPCEIAIVDDGKTGLVVHDPGEFADVVEWLGDNPGEQEKLGRNAARYVRENFQPEKMAEEMTIHYQTVFTLKKQRIPFTELLGSNPAEWYWITRRKPSEILPEVEQKFGGFSDDDQTKGTLRHFSKYFPDDQGLNSL